MSDNIDDIQKQFADLLDRYNKKTITPTWFKYNLKTLVNKNITIEDWNRAQMYLGNFASENETLLEMCKLFADRDSLIMIKYVPKEVTKDDTTSKILNEGTKIDLVVGNNKITLDKNNFTYNENIILDETMTMSLSDIQNAIIQGGNK